MEARVEERREGLWRALGPRTIAIGALATSAVVHAALVFEHSGEPLLAGSFAAAAVAAAVVAFALTRLEVGVAPLAAAALLGGLLVAYPFVYAVRGDPVDALGIATKLVEGVGLLATLRARDDRDVSLAPVTAIGGFLLAFLLLSVAGESHTHTHGHLH
jgi:hypothetical protein